MSVCSSVGWLVCKKVSQKATPYLQKNIVLDSLHPVPGDGVGVHQLQHGQPVSPGHVQSAHRGKIAKASSLNWTYEFFFFKYLLWLQGAKKSFTSRLKVFLKGFQTSGYYPMESWINGNKLR